MCGIIALTGNRAVQALLVGGLRRLEKRGYDSSGIAVLEAGRIARVRTEGATARLQPLVLEMSSEALASQVGIAHTRWATHGSPSEQNAHPHVDCTGSIALVHNGTIENWRELRRSLVEAGHALTSQTDTELIAHLIEEALREQADPVMAVRAALYRLHGSYGLVVMFRDFPGQLVAARSGSPLLVGKAEGMAAAASTAEALFEVTREVTELQDGDVALLSANGSILIQTRERALVDRPYVRIETEDAAATLDGYPHYMLKEMMQQPNVVRDALAGRIDPETGVVKLGGLADARDQLLSTTGFLIVGCGSAFRAGLFGRRVIQRLVGLPVDVQIASEFIYDDAVICSSGTTMVAISQSGETRETVLAVERWKKEERFAIGILNGVGSQIARLTGVGMYTRAGEEHSVASTKAFVSQLVSLVLFALYLAQMHEERNLRNRELAKALYALPDLIQSVLEQRSEIARIAERFSSVVGMFYLGRQAYEPIAREGALKLKELSYVHAEAYPVGEMKHGPFTLVCPEFPCLVLCPRDGLYDKTRGAIAEIVTRKGPVIVLTDQGNVDFAVEAEGVSVMLIPDCHELLKPILYAIALQLFAYEMAVARGTNVDQPRNLAKIVTVE